MIKQFVHIGEHSAIDNHPIPVVGKCDLCSEVKQLHRTYFQYEDIICSCHGPNHFEMVAHCDSCEPEVPKKTEYETQQYVP